MRSDKSRPTVIGIVLQLLYIFILQISLRTSGKFQPKNYKISCNLAENYKSWQNMANRNISRIFGSAGFFFKTRLGSLLQANDSLLAAGHSKLCSYI